MLNLGNDKIFNYFLKMKNGHIINKKKQKTAKY